MAQKRWLITSNGIRRRYNIKDKNLRKNYFYNSSQRGWSRFISNPVVWVDFYFGSGKVISSPKCAMPIQLYGNFAHEDDAKEKAVEQFNDETFQTATLIRGENVEFEPSLDARYHYDKDFKRLNG